MSRNRLPNRRNAQIAMFEHDGRRYRATFGTFGSGALAEVFLDSGKADSTLQQHADDSAAYSPVCCCKITYRPHDSAINFRADPQGSGYLVVREGGRMSTPRWQYTKQRSKTDLRTAVHGHTKHQAAARHCPTCGCTPCQTRASARCAVKPIASRRHSQSTMQVCRPIGTRCQSANFGIG